jgi:hypothetical protein
MKNENGVTGSWIAGSSLQNGLINGKKKISNLPQLWLSAGRLNYRFIPATGNTSRVWKKYQF